jgi:hypothetical protein
MQEARIMRKSSLFKETSVQLMWWTATKTTLERVKPPWAENPPKQVQTVHGQKRRDNRGNCNCSITPGNSAWIAERAGFRRYDFVDNAQHFQVIPTKVGIQMFFFGVRLPSVIE